MKIFWFSALFISGVHARHLQADDGSGLWIASIGDDADCDTLTDLIMELSTANRRRLGDDMATKTFIDKMQGDDDCFVEFSGSDDFAHNVIGKLEGVDEISPDEEVGMFWGRDRADQEDLPLDGSRYRPPFDGDGQCLYIIDTGVYPMHRDFTGRAMLGADFINENDKNDMNGHGTHCSSIAAGAMYGIAPGTSSIYGVKVLSGSGSGSSAGVIKGIQWAVSHANKMKKTCVLSLSLGGGANGALDKAAADAAKKHFVIVAAGNSDMSACSSSPARAGGKVITVGSTKKDDFRSSFSNYGKCVNIFGPGSDIEAAYIGSKKMTKTLSGTSMATPYIAGLALQSLQKNDGNYNKAYNDLMANAVANKIKDVGTGSPNLLGLAFTYTGPPTPPTLKPTMPPIMPDPTLCKWNSKTKKYDICVKFEASLFGPQPWQYKPFIAPVMHSTMGDKMLCQPTSEDFTGKFAIIKRGECLFHQKVVNAQKQGAVGVFIYAEKNTLIFPPQYYGDNKAEVPSCMISSTAGTQTFKTGNMVHWGPVMKGDNKPPAPTMAPTMKDDKPSMSPTMKPTRAMKTKRPTMTPTKRPTRAPTVTLRCDNTTDRAMCKKRKRCAWDGYICFIRYKYQKN